MKIGVFDSGVGGLAIARAVRKALPDEEVVYVNDREHMPYGDKTPQQMLGLVEPILQKLADEGCEVIVVACNTVTTTIIDELRRRIAVPLVGIEPMVKPAAAATKTGVIAIRATPTTLHSPRYAWLKKTYAAGLKVLEPDCSQWARMIEDSAVNEHKIEAQVKSIRRSWRRHYRPRLYALSLDRRHHRPHGCRSCHCHSARTDRRGTAQTGDCWSVPAGR